MRYIEALDEWTYHTGDQELLFLAGGITGCTDWQEEMVELLKDEDLVILNPRRKNFPIDDPNAAEEQIEWEWRHLKVADMVLFWFPNETLCPITLFELGTRLKGPEGLFVGCQPGYAREQDVRIQLGLARPQVEVVNSLPELAHQVQQAIRYY